MNQPDRCLGCQRVQGSTEDDFDSEREDRDLCMSASVSGMSRLGREESLERADWESDRRRMELNWQDSW